MEIKHARLEKLFYLELIIICVVMVADLLLDLTRTQTLLTGLISFHGDSREWLILNLLFWMIALTGLVLIIRKKFFGWLLLVGISIDLFVFSIAALYSHELRAYGVFALIHITVLMYLINRPAVLKSLVPRVRVFHFLLAMLFALALGSLFLFVPQKS